MPAGLRLLRPYGARHANRDFLAAAGLAALLTIGFGAWMALRADGGDAQSDAIRRFGEAGAALIAAVACMIAAAYHSGRSRFAWVLLGTGALAWAAGEGVGAYYQFIGQQLRYPPLTDIGHLAAVPLAVAGIAVFPGRHRGSSRIAFLLDGAILAGALVLISWATVLGSVYHAHTGGGTPALTGLAYPISDVVMAVMALLLVGRTAGAGRLPLLLVMTGIFANLLADSGSVYLTTVTGHAPDQIMGTGWVAGFLLMALGAVRAALLAGSAPRADDRPPARWAIFIPYIPVAVAAVIAVLKNVSGPPEALLLWDLIVVVALVIVRQFIVILDNQTLNQKLASQSAALRESEDHFRALVQNSGDAVLLADADGVVRFASSSMDRFFAYTSTELVGQRFSELLHPTDQAAFAAGMKKALAASALPVVVHCRFWHKLGSWTHCEVTITNLLHQSSSHALVLNIRDVTDRKDMEERLAHLAAHDPVTSLPNRLSFRNQLDEALQRSVPGRGVAVLALDIDDFKLVNDALGERASDDLLGMIGGRLGKLIPPADVVARLGADEFAVLMQSVIHDEDPVRLADRIVEHFKAPFRVQEREIILRLSMGIAAQAGPEDTAETMMRNADIALNAAKAHGKGRYERYEAQQHVALSARMELESDLARALERRQFVLHYQPAVRLRDGTLIGFEALVRWNHPRRGLLSPGDFIALADDTGLIAPLQRWVLGQACADGRHWQIQFPVARGLHVSVNVSQRGLADADLAADVEHACTAAVFAPEHLVLELTQGATLEGKDTLARLLQLHERGVKLALDDFGAGSAPLTALRDLPVDIVKLDHSFVARMAASSTDATVARAVIDLGNTLGMMTMADGIERAEQFSALRAIGCVAGQGYYLSRPLTATAVERLLAEGDVTDAGLRLPGLKLEKAA
ncbi:MAG TPA: EAL domain-containing protein [Candidatus Dormibacteraeota bacterium]|nr:EAL domain-containing protein [Candidatus Dormibacteraeota bacterium]